MEPRHVKTHMTAHLLLSFFRSVTWYCSVFHSLTPDAQIRTGQSTEVTADGTKASGVDEDNAHIIDIENGREVARTVR